MTARLNMGPLRFTQNPPLASLLFTPVLVLALVALGGLLLHTKGFTGDDGFTLDDVLLGGLVIAGGLASGWACWGVVRSRTRVFQDGLVHGTSKGEVRILFRELKSFTYGEARDPQGAPARVHVMRFMDERGAEATLQSMPDGSLEKELAGLRDDLAELLANKLETRLEAGVSWLPGVELRREGLHFPGADEPPLRFSPSLPISIEQERCVVKRGGLTRAGSTDLPNFYPGLRLIERCVRRESERLRATPPAEEGEKARRREFKREGKRLVEESSERVRRLVEQTFSGDARLQSETRERQRELDENRTRVVPTESVGRDVLLLPAGNALDQGLDVFNFQPVPGWYLRCKRCGDLVPMCARVPLSCRCDNVHLEAHGTRWAFGPPRTIEPVKVFAKVNPGEP